MLLYIHIMTESVARLDQVVDALHLTTSVIKRTIFVYSAPKVGSTSLVSSFRIFCSHLYNVIHIHDEHMVALLLGVRGISVNDVIRHTRQVLGHDVYVIDIYRNPIERKMSVFFEKIASFHFNMSNSDMIACPMHKLVKRFNQLFIHIGEGDWFLDKYSISVPPTFDVSNKYVKVEQDGVHYVKLRLMDFSKWPSILSSLFGTPIRVVSDNEGMNTELKPLYLKFKQMYLIPSVLLKHVMSSRDVNYFLSDDEKHEYANEWGKRTTCANIHTFNKAEFMLYMSLMYDNRNRSDRDDVQYTHYRDCGCKCSSCKHKRAILARKILNNQFIGNERVVHDDDYPRNRRLYDETSGVQVHFGLNVHRK